MPGLFTYKDLDAWKRGMELVECCYKVTGMFPRSELYGITSQIRRAAVSIPSNVAEGHCRRSTRAYANHVSIALGSHGELETCLELACRLGLVSREDKVAIDGTTESVGQLLSALHRALEEKLAHNSAPAHETR